MVAESALTRFFVQSVQGRSSKNPVRAVGSANSLSHGETRPPPSHQPLLSKRPPHGPAGRARAAAAPGTEAATGSGPRKRRGSQA